MPHSSSKKRRSVLVLAAEFPPLGGGGVIRVTKLVKYLDRLGWQVEVASSDEPLANAVDHGLLEEIPRSVRIQRVRPPFHGVARRVTAAAKGGISRSSLLFRALFSARQAVRNAVAIPDRWLPWAIAVAQTGRLATPDVIVGSGPPHSVHLASALLARRWRVPFVVDMRDEWTLRPLTRSRLPWRVVLERRLERWILPRAAAIVVVSEESQVRYSARYPQAAARIRVIPNGYDPEDFENIPLETAPPGPTLTVGYAGSFQSGSDVKPFFTALGNVVRRGVGGREVRFEMLGPFLPEELEIARARVPRGRFTIGSFVPHREALRRMARWDVLCVVAGDGEASLAGKFYECLALRRPIVVLAPEGAARRLVRQLEVGAAGDPSDASSIEAALAEGLSMRERFTGIGDEELRRYSRQAQAEMWSQLLVTLIERAVRSRKEHREGADSPDHAR